MKRNSRRKSSVASLLPNFVKPTDEYEVWVLGTWVHETGHAAVRFTGSVEECVSFRIKSEDRSRLSIRPTGRTIAAA